MRSHQAKPYDAEYDRRTAAHWRTRVDGARVIAQQMGEDHREKMLHVAKVFDDLAKQEERREGLTRISIRA